MDRIEEIRRYSEDPGFRSDEHILKKEDALFLLSEIDRLKKENKELREAVEPLIKIYDSIKAQEAANYPEVTIWGIKENLHNLKVAYEKGER